MGSLGRGCAAAALAIGLGSYLVGAGAAPGYADTSFQVQTAATGAHFTLTQEPASSIVTASLVDDATAYTATAFDASGSSEAQAASIYPGNLVVQGPSLFCSEVFTCPVTPPDYPLLADASYPRRQHAEASADQKSVGSGPLVVSPGASVASANGTGNEARTLTGGISALSGSPAAVSVGASSSLTRVTTSASAVVVHVESAASDIEVAGLLHIESVVAVDDVTLSAGARPRDVPHITVAGATVAGQPASIDETGIHVAGHNGPKLTQTLAKNGIALRTVGVDRADSTSVARSVATGLQIDMSVPVSGLPYVPNPLPAPFDQVPGVNANGTYVGHLTLGAAGVAAGANILPAFSLGGISPLSPTGGATTSAGVTGVAAQPPLGGTVTGAATQAQPQVAPRASGFSAVLDGFTTNLADLYAVLALGTGVLFIGWRTIAAARRRPAGGRRA